MNIMIFLEGTIFDARTEEISVKNYKPIGNCVEKINEWKREGNRISLCTYVDKQNIDKIKIILDYYKITYDNLYYREKNINYKDIVEKVIPDVLIEDNCQSIGGIKEMCITNVDESLKKKIKSIVIEEFKGIDSVEL